MITILPNGNGATNGNGSINGTTQLTTMTMGKKSAKNNKRKSTLNRKAYFALSIFVIGAVHFIIAQQVMTPTRNISLALVRNEFLDKPPTKIVVMGEINSGDKYAANVLRHAFAQGMTILHEHIHRRDLLSQNELNEIAGRTDVLWIMVVRSPCTWADSLIRFQRESCEKGELPREQCQAHEFASDTDYYRMPWYDGLHDDRHDYDSDDLKENIVESKPGHNSKYDDIFDMRQQKLLLMKQIMDAVPRHVKILRLSEFELNPDVFVKDLVKEYQFKLSKQYTPPPPTVDPSSMFFNPKQIFSCMEYSKWKEAQQRIDWTLEGYFGHNHLECHLCRDGLSGAQAIPSSDGQSSLINTPSNIYVLGERNSGTTYVSNTLAEAFDPPNTMGSNLEKFSSDIPVLLHKHMFRHELLDGKELAEIRARDDILWILVVRSPCDWAEGMFRKPYHLCPPKHPEKCGPESDPHSKVWMNQNSVAGVPLLNFFTKMEWNDWAESVPFLRDADGESKGGEEVAISKVSANYTYSNVFGLRRHKLAIMKQIMETVPRNVKFVHLKELERSPEIFIQGVVREFNLTVKEGYKPQPPSKVSHPTVCLTNHEWDAAQSNIDWRLEAEFGFSPFDCRMCYGYEKSTRLFDRVMQGKKIRKILVEEEKDKKQNEKEQGKRKQQSRKRAKTAKKQDGENANTSEKQEATQLWRQSRKNISTQKGENKNNEKTKAKK